ncbi:unnamed protein product, partial [Polarella glacialis]
ILPVWPPPPQQLLRQGGAAAAIGVLLLAIWGYSTSSGGDDGWEQDGVSEWVAQERRQRQAKLRDLLAQLPLDRLCDVVPGLRSLLSSGLVGAETAAKEASSEAAGAEVSSFALTAEDVADAAEELAKADCCAEDAWEGFAVAAALT